MSEILTAALFDPQRHLNPLHVHPATIADRVHRLFQAPEIDRTFAVEDGTTAAFDDIILQTRRIRDELLPLRPCAFASGFY